MPRYSNAPGAMDALRYDVTNLAYHARHSGRAAIVGVGSGRDMLSASFLASVTLPVSSSTRSSSIC